MTSQAAMHLLQWISDSWIAVIGLLLALTVAGIWGRLRPYSTALRFPVILLAARKIALFVPFPGTISIPDQVIFWSVPAYVYFFIVLLAVIAIGIACVLRYRSPSSVEAELLGTVATCAYIGLLIGSVACLPVSGWWTHFYMPVLCIVGAIKVLVASPLLLPLAWGGLGLQLALCFTRGISTGREINKLLLAGVVIAGLLQAAVQPVNYLRCQDLRMVRYAWQRSQSRLTSLDGYSEEAYEYRTPMEGDIKYTRDFIGCWAYKIPQIWRTGLNVVERDAPYEVERDGVAKTMQRLAPFHLELGGPPALRAALIVAAMLIVLMILAERAPSRDESSAQDQAVQGEC